MRPTREIATSNGQTYFVTSNTAGRTPFFRNERSDHRIRDTEDFEVHQSYIARNAVKAGMVKQEAEYAYCSANGTFALDAFPRGLKPGLVEGAGGAAKAAPFQGQCTASPK